MWVDAEEVVTLIFAECRWFNRKCLIREQSLNRAIADYPDADQIPLRNIERMKSLGEEKLIELMQACLGDNVRNQGDLLAWTDSLARKNKMCFNQATTNQTIP